MTNTAAHPAKELQSAADEVQSTVSDIMKDGRTEVSGRDVQQEVVRHIRYKLAVPHGVGRGSSNVNGEPHTTTRPDWARQEIILTHPYPRHSVTIPPGVRPGQRFSAVVRGKQRAFMCPVGARSSDRIVVTIPKYNKLPANTDDDTSSTAWTQIPRRVTSSPNPSPGQPQVLLFLLAVRGSLQLLWMI